MLICLTLESTYDDLFFEWRLVAGRFRRYRQLTAGRNRSFFFLVEVAANHVGGTEQSVAECISDDALIHLKSYKYSSVDKSPVSKYILGPWVRLTDYSPPHRRMTLRFAPYMSMPLRAIDTSQKMNPGV